MQRILNLVLICFLLSIPLYSCGQIVNFDKDKKLFSRDLEREKYGIGFHCSIFDLLGEEENDEIEFADDGGKTIYEVPDFLHDRMFSILPPNTPLLYRNSPFTGKVVSFYPNGGKKWEYTFLNGLRNGILMTYFENGEVQSKIQFKQGLFDGDYLRYCENGSLDKRFYKDGELNGVWEFYQPNGDVFFRNYYKEGKVDETKSPYYDPSILILDSERNKYRFWRNRYHN